MKQLVLLLAFFTLQQTICAQNKVPPIHAEVSGKGAPVIFIPGFTVPGDIWKPLVTELETHYECHVFTLAGFGGKQAIDFPWLPQINQALKNYMIQKNLKNVTIIGHSLGGTIATWLAVQPDLNLKTIILVDALPAAGALMIPNFNPDELIYDSAFNNQQLQMSDTAFEQMASAMAKGMSLNSAGQELIKKWMITSDRQTYVYGYTDYLKLDVRPALSKIKIPVTIIAATQPYGEEIIKQTYKIQYDQLNNYDLIVAQNAAHFIMLDQPDWFNKQIKTLLAVE
jgi:pimeloyl-ACP methyl ester carboxylesterase